MSVGDVSVGDVSGWENVHRGCAWSGKCPSGMCLVGEMSVGDVSGNLYGLLYIVTYSL